MCPAAAGLHGKDHRDRAAEHVPRHAARWQVIGIELGADVGAHIDLDEFMVFEQNEEQARAFFASLFFKHLTSTADDGTRLDGLTSPPT